MLWSELHPHVSFANRLICTPGFSFGPRIIHDHQFIFIAEGKGKATIQHASYEVREGDLFYYGAGIVHHFTSALHEPFVLYGIHFSLQHSTLGDGVTDQAVALDVEEAYPRDKLNQFHLRNGQGDTWLIPEHVRPNKEWVLQYFNQIVTNFNRSTTVDDLYNRSLLTTFLIELYRQTNQMTAQDENTSLMMQLKDKLAERAAESYDRTWLHEWTGYHENYCAALFRKAYGQSPHDFFVERKIALAKHLLTTTSLNISEIAMQLHVSSIHYFSRLFKQHTGQSPHQFRKISRMI